jgi:hypothetical protein
MFIGYPVPFLVGLASWCVAFGPPSGGLRKLRPQVELHSFRGEVERLGNGAETTRPPRLGYEAFVTRSALEWNGETAVLHVERANSRR